MQLSSTGFFKYVWPFSRTSCWGVIFEGLRSNLMFYLLTFIKYFLAYSYASTTFYSIKIAKKQKQNKTSVSLSHSTLQYLSPFLPNVPFWSPWKHLKTFGFLMISGGSKGNIGKKKAENNIGSYHIPTSIICQFQPHIHGWTWHSGQL